MERAIETNYKVFVNGGDEAVELGLRVTISSE